MRRVFLLGGHDLEMETIRLLLEDRGEEYIDKDLSWKNAELSAYYNDMSDVGALYYGIELRGLPPSGVNYVLVDHHNDNSGKPASIAQVAAVLGVALTRFQQLVAANDAGYIDGMRQIGATDTEIAAVRQKDRQMQGVTAEEEAMAEEEVQRVALRQGIKVLKTDLSHFSPLVDRLYPYGRLLLYNNHELTYYGHGADKLVTSMARLVEQGAAYYGGNGCAFFGIGAGHFPPETIAAYANQIVGLLGVRC